MHTSRKSKIEEGTDDIEQYRWVKGRHRRNGCGGVREAPGATGWRRRHVTGPRISLFCKSSPTQDLPKANVRKNLALFLI